MEIICKQCSKTCRANLKKRGEEFVVVGACPHCGHQNVIQRNDPRFDQLTQGKFPELNIPPLSKQSEQAAPAQMVTVTSRKAKSRLVEVPPVAVAADPVVPEQLESPATPQVAKEDVEQAAESPLDKPANGTPVDPPKPPRKSTKSSPKPGIGRNRSE